MQKPFRFGVVSGGVSSRPEQQAIEFLLEQRERLGISYIQINHAQIENFVPVLTQLNGK